MTRTYLCDHDAKQVEALHPKLIAQAGKQAVSRSPCSAASSCVDDLDRSGTMTEANKVRPDFLLPADGRRTRTVSYDMLVVGPLQLHVDYCTYSTAMTRGQRR